MAHFVQPINREADLRAVMEGYEGVIGHEHWLSDAFQKDGIQNSWDARVNKKGEGWSCELFYKEVPDKGIKTIGIKDKGTTGLTGTIPEIQEQLVQILISEDPNERLAYFSSTSWSKKPEDALGSRGRGKIIFVGASEDKVMYFDSLRSDDNRYIFGKTYLDQNKSISVDINWGEKADEERDKIFGSDFHRLTEFGTRIFIPNPKQELITAFQNGFTEQHIQSTWWEILHKYKADILLDNNGWKKQIKIATWMPVSSLGIKETESFEFLSLPKYPELKIKRISFCYLGEKELPDSYKGLAIQRCGMVVERYPVTKLIGESIGERIIGSVELEKDLETKIRDNEGPEHYNIFWNRSIPGQLKTLLKEKAVMFARKYKLMEEERKTANREQRQVEVAAQKDLNDLAKKLGFTSGHEIAPRKINKGKRKPDEKIRLSIPNFETPYNSGRVDIGQSVKGTYVIPLAQIDIPLNVLVCVWILYKDEIVKKEEKELKIEKEILLPTDDIIRIGWDEIEIGEEFVPGKYSFRAKMIAMEDKVFNPDWKIEKGQEIYGPISRTFYVGEDPPENEGVFKYQAVSSLDKSKFYWWEYIDRAWTIYYNVEHPEFKLILADSDLLKKELDKTGILALFSILCTEDISLNEENKNTKIFSPKDVSGSDFGELLKLVVQKQSEVLWEKEGK